VNPKEDFMPKVLPVAKLRVDPAYQFRDNARGCERCADPKVAEEFASLIEDKVKFPPVKAALLPNKQYLVYGGFHTLEAYRLRGAESVPVEVKAVKNKEEVLDLACAENRHGQGRSKGTVLAQVASLLSRHPDWTDGKIAQLVGVNRTTVLRHRQSLEAPAPEAEAAGKAGNGVPLNGPSGTRTVHRGGKTYPYPVRPRGRGGDAPVADGLGDPVPERLRPVFTATAQENLADALARGRTEVVGAPGTAHLNLAEVHDLLERAEALLRNAAPFCVCPGCKGELEECGECSGHGYLTYAMHEALAGK
jgi:hypothetical protein